jgi:hypothetical protein
MRLAVLLLLASAIAGAPTVGPVPDKLRGKLGLSPFYAKYLDANGLPVLASAKVDDRALVAAADLVTLLLKDRPDVRRKLIIGKVRIAVMAPDELTTDIPEHSDLRPKKYWDARARGLGPTPQRPACSVGAENLLGLKGDKYRGESILIHEFSHAIHEMGLNRISGKFEKQLKKLYEDAKKQGRWKDTYAMTNAVEYWAEGVQSYFDANLEAIPTNGIHNHVNTREELRRHDPELFALIAKTFRNAEWRWKDPAR